MGVLDKVGKKVTDTGQKTVQKTKQISENVRLNGMISQNQNKINEMYYQIGKRYAEIHRTDPEGAFAEMMTQIGEWERQITEFTRQMQREQEPGICTACGERIPDGANFCIACGTPAPKKTIRRSAEDDSYVQCPHCGASVQKLNFCTECGQALTPPVPHPVPVPPSPVPYPVPVPPSPVPGPAPVPPAPHPVPDPTPVPPDDPANKYWKTPEL